MAVVGVVLMISFVVGFGGGGAARPGAVERELGRAGGHAGHHDRGRRGPRRAGGRHPVRPAVRPADDPGRAGVAAGRAAQAGRGGEPGRPARAVRAAPPRGGRRGASCPTPPRPSRSWTRRSAGTPPTARRSTRPAPDCDAYEAVKGGVSDLMMVAGYYARVTAALKPSRPAVDRALADAGQSVQLTLVPLTPTRPSGRRPRRPAAGRPVQAYADVAPGRPDAGNPFGFGYRVAAPHPPAVRPPDPGRRRAGRGRHPERLRLGGGRPQAAPGAPRAVRRQPAHDPPDGRARPGRSRRRTSRSATRCCASLRDPLVQALQDQVQQFLATTMARDFAAYQAAVAAGRPAPVAAGGPAVRRPRVPGRARPTRPTPSSTSRSTPTRRTTCRPSSSWTCPAWAAGTPHRRRHAPAGRPTGRFRGTCPTAGWPT